MKWRHIAMVAAGMAGVGALAGALWLRPSAGSDRDTGPSASERRPPDTRSAFDADACDPSLLRALAQPGLGRRAQCGRVTVPLGRDTRRMIQVGVVRLLTTETSSRPPILLLAGGPGDSFSPHLADRLEYLLPLAVDRDLLIVDQRGTGQGDPILDCHETMRSKEDLGRCYEDWNKDIDVAAFSTQNSAADLKVVLDALGIPRVVVVAVSYGTRLAATFAEAYPGMVHSLVLDSPMPRTIDVLSQAGQNARRALSAIFAECDRDPGCKSRLPHTEADVLAVVEALDKPDSRGPSGKEFLSKLMQLSVTPAVLPFVPYLLEQAGKGDFSLFGELGSGFSEYEFSFGLHLSVQCAETFPLVAPSPAAGEAEGGALLGLLGADSYADSCSVWRVPALPTPSKEAIWSAPTLVLWGEFDPVTSSDYARIVAKGLENVRELEVPNVSHAAGLSACGVLLIRQFLDVHDGGGSPTLPSCATDTAPLGFALSAPEPAELARVIHQIRYRL